MRAMALWQWFLIGQAVAFPTLAPGSEVRLVSPDLLRVHASGSVRDDELVLEGELPPGLEVRMLIFPPDAGAEEAAAALSGATALTARVTDAGDGLRILPADGAGEAYDWRTALQEQGITLRLPNEGDEER